LIAALEGQTLPPDDFEVIVSDDGSRDDTPAVLKELSERTRLQLRVVRSDENRGSGAARNAAWQSSEAPVIAFTDDDCLPTPRWLEAGLAALQDPTVGIVQGRTLPDPAAPKEGRSLTVERFTMRYETCNIFYRTDVLRAVGGFDEGALFTKKRAFGEDTELGWKARTRGIKGVYKQDALVHHAVTYPGFGFWWRYAMKHANWALLVRRFPAMRRELLWQRLFLRRRHAGFLVATAGVAVGASLWWPAYFLAAPYLWRRRPRTFALRSIGESFWETTYDLLQIIALVKGSLRERTLVL
jgi:GT2 family glycosyltransferase